MRLNLIPLTTRSIGGMAILASCCLYLTSPALAEVNRGGKDKTICYIFKNNKLVTKNSCSYEATIGGSTSYGISDYDFTIKGFGSISTYSHSNAIARYRQITSYKILRYEAQDIYQKQNPKKVLSCMATKNNSLEVCIPLSKANLESA